MRFAGHGSTDGGLRTLVAWPEQLAHPLPDSVTDEVAPLLEPLGVALHAVDLGCAAPGATAAVFGCGPIGLLLVQALQAAGVAVEVATDPLPHRAVAARELGARRSDPAGVQVDVAYEAAGDHGALDAAIAATRPGGRVVVVGIPDDDRSSLPRRRGTPQGADARHLPPHARRRPRARDRPRRIRAAGARVARERAVRARRGAAGVPRPGRAAGSEGGGPAVTCALGIDFGTESARAVLVDCDDGRELGTSVAPYAHGVIDQRLPDPDEDVELEADWALQDPRDYLESLQIAVRRLLAETGVPPDEVVGVGIDFTSCTMLPTLADGTPLCLLEDLRREPHAWVKLWKHHAAQPEADRINAVAAERGERWLPRYGGKISSEWFFAKALQILDEAPEVYARAARLIEACDWVVWQLTGVESRSACAAGYKAMWSKRDGFPPPAYFAALDPRFEHVVDEKLSRTLLPPGVRAGGLSERAAAWTGLRAGTPVAVGNVDFHGSVPATTVTAPGTLVMIMGTSNGHLLLGDELVEVEGMCGVVEDGIVPGYFGYEAGQSALGDIFAWFTRQAVPPEYHEAARARGVDVHDVLAEEAAALRPGQSGLLALDWWNGNRSVLVDADLCGLLVGHDACNARPRDLPGPDRGDGVRHAGDRRGVRAGGAAGGHDRRLRWAPRPEPPSDADLRRRR